MRPVHDSRWVTAAMIISVATPGEEQPTAEQPRVEPAAEVRAALHDVGVPEQEAEQDHDAGGGDPVEHRGPVAAVGHG